MEGFKHGVSHIVPLICSAVTQWDSNLVLSILQEPPLETIGYIEDMSIRTSKVSKSPSLQFVSKLVALKAPFCTTQGQRCFGVQGLFFLRWFLPLIVIRALFYNVSVLLLNMLRRFTSILSGCHPLRL